MDSSDTNIYYRGYAIQTLVYKHPAAVRPEERTYDVAVRICLETDPMSSGEIHSVLHTSPFSNFGDARRAAVECAQGIINEKLRVHATPSPQRRAKGVRTPQQAPSAKAL